MSTPIRTRATAALWTWLLPLLPCPAQEPSAPGDVEPPQVEAPALQVSAGHLSLTIEQALILALQNDIGLSIEEVAGDVARLEARGSWGAFDWLFAANATVTDSEEEASSQLSGADVLTFNTQFVSLDLTRALQTGGTFAVHFDRTNSETNNTFILENPFTSDGVRASFTQPLLRGFGSEVATAPQQQAELVYRQAQERRRQVAHDLLLRVSDAYWNLVLARQQLSVAESSRELAAEQLERDRRVNEAGLNTDVEVLQAEAQLALREEARLQALLNVRTADDLLKLQLFPGKDRESWDTRLEPVTPLPEPASVEAPSDTDWSHMLAVALENRGDLRQARLGIELAEVRLRQAVSQRRAQLDLQVVASSGGFSGQASEAFEEAFSYEFPTYTIGLVFSVPLGNRTARYAERAARAQVRSATLLVEQAESLAASEVRDARRQLAHQAQAVAAAATSLAASRRQLEAEQARNREGISTNFQVLQFQDQFVQAAQRENSARASFMQAKARWLAVQGILGD
jgi:HAE1 family hydrophobic/amphiphilic exporter-1